MAAAIAHHSRRAMPKKNPAAITASVAAK